MSYDEIPMYREIDPQIDFVKLQLLTVVNQLKLEIMQSKREFRKQLSEMFNFIRCPRS